MIWTELHSTVLRWSLTQSCYAYASVFWMGDDRPTLLLQQRHLTLFENFSKCRIWILAFSTNFCPIKSDLSGNTVWPQASDFQKLCTYVYLNWNFGFTLFKFWSILGCWKSHTGNYLVQGQVSRQRELSSGCYQLQHGTSNITHPWIRLGWIHMCGQKRGGRCS